jgi:hypothetical protein
MNLASELQSALGDIPIDSYPWLSFPDDCQIQVMFPFGGAAARFRIRRPDNPERSISVYLDTANVLGYCNSSYWEAYPIDGDTYRVAMNEVDELIKVIVAELDREGL